MPKCGRSGRPTTLQSAYVRHATAAVTAMKARHTAARHRGRRATAYAVATTCGPVGRAHIARPRAASRLVGVGELMQDAGAVGVEIGRARTAHRIGHSRDLDRAAERLDRA